MTLHTAPPAAPISDPDRFALRLGHGLLAPFVAGALLMWLVHAEVRPLVALALAAYAAVIVSFLGGVDWGLAMRQAAPPHRLLAWGVLPVVLAWLAVIMPPASGLVVAAVALLAGYFIDRRLYPAQGVAHWLTLRFRLGAVAALCCFIAAGAAGD